MLKVTIKGSHSSFKIFYKYSQRKESPLTSQKKQEISYEQARELIIQYAFKQAKEEIALKFRKDDILNQIQNETFEDVIKGE